MTTQLGIPRTMTLPPSPQLSGRDDPASLRVDLAKVLQYAQSLAGALATTADRQARRMNEMLGSGPLATRPTAGIQDRFFFATDQAAGSRVTYDTGSAWTAP